MAIFTPWVVQGVIRNKGRAVKPIVFSVGLLLWGALAHAQAIDDGTVIHQCKIKGFHPGMTWHEKVRLLGDRYGDAAKAKDACYRSEEEFAKFYNLAPGEAKSLYGQECRAASDELVLEKGEMEEVFGACVSNGEEFARELAFASGIYFQHDAETNSYNYENAKDKCAVTIDKDVRLILSRAVASARGKK